MASKSKNRSKQSGSSKPDSDQKSASKSNILTFPGPNQSSNFAFWLELIEQKSLLDYGNLGRMYKLNDYYVPPEIKYDANDLSTAKDPLGMARKAIESQIINRSKEMSEMERNRTPMFALILSRITDEGRQKMEQDPGWQAIDDSKDPLSLFKLVKKTHLTSLSTSKISVNDKTIAWNHFNNVRQS